MTKSDARKQKNLRPGLVIPTITILLSSFLFMGVGFAGLTSTVDVSGYTSTSGIIIELKKDDTALKTGEFSTGEVVKYTKVDNNNYFVFINSYKLGESILIIDATGSNAESVNLSIEISYRVGNENTYTTVAPYNIEPVFVLEYIPEEDEDIEVSPFEIGQGESSAIGIKPGINRFHIEFYGNVTDTYHSSSLPADFNYQLLFTVETP